MIAGFKIVMMTHFHRLRLLIMAALKSCGRCDSLGGVAMICVNHIILEGVQFTTDVELCM